MQCLAVALAPWFTLLLGRLEFNGKLVVFLLPFPKHRKPRQKEALSQVNRQPQVPKDPLRK